MTSGIDNRAKRRLVGRAATALDESIAADAATSRPGADAEGEGQRRRCEADSEACG